MPDDKVDLDSVINEFGAEPAPEPAEEPVAPAAEPAVDQLKQLSEDFNTLKSGYEDRESGYKRVIEEQSGRMKNLETLVNQGYQNVHQPAPEPEKIYTQEELVKAPMETIDKIAENKARKIIEQNNAQVSEVVGTLIERSHRSELDALKGERFYTQLKPKLEQTFKDNPGLKTQANSAQMAYNMLVGQNLEELINGETPAVEPTPPAKTTPLGTPPGGGPAGPAAPDAEPAKEIELTPAQKALQAKFARLGTKLEAGDFEA